MQATEAVRGQIFMKFGMPPQLKQCCKSCFRKLHRATAEFATYSVHAITGHEVENKKGRPTVNYENASTKTKKRIEKKAMELLNKTIINLKDSYTEISGGCGEELLNLTLQAANLPIAQTSTEVKVHIMHYFFLKHFSGPESGILEFDWLLTRVPPVQFFPIRTGFVMDH